MSGFAFSRSIITIAVGTEMMWTNNDGVTQTVTSDGGVSIVGTSQAKRPLATCSAMRDLPVSLCYSRLYEGL
jgi:plastocyanin